MIFQKIKKERVKDILIDHVYDFCFNEIVHKMEGGGHSITFESYEQLQSMKPNMTLDSIKRADDSKTYFTNRNEEFCNLDTSQDNLHKSLIEKLLKSGFSKSRRLKKSIVEAKEFLIARSYFIQGKPIESRVKLTDKGKQHYLSGQSFEDNYINRRNSNIAIAISIASAIIALIAIFNK